MPTTTINDLIGLKAEFVEPLGEELPDPSISEIAEHMTARADNYRYTGPSTNHKHIAVGN